MLEQLLIFTRGGLILWICKEFGIDLKGSPINALITSCFLEERSYESSYSYEAPGASYTMKWTFNNDLGLIFVAVYQKILHFLYVDDVLAVKKQKAEYRELAQLRKEIYDPKKTDYNDFDNVFSQLRKEVEDRAELLKISKQVGRAAPVALGKKQGQDATGRRSDGKNGKQKGNGSSKDDGEDSDSAKEHKENGNPDDHNQNGVQKTVDVNNNSIDNSEAFDKDKLSKRKTKGCKYPQKPKNLVTECPPKPKPKRKSTKKKDDAPGQTKLLDHSDAVAERGIENNQVVAVDLGKSMMDEDAVSSSDREKEEDEVASKDPKLNEKNKGWFSSIFQSIAGKANLEKSDLEPALKALKDRLLTKNVAEEIAEKLCEYVAASLVGKKLASFTSVSSTVKAEMEDALLRILTPKRSIDVLRDVHAAKEQGRPYVITFVGVNGVGKSTNLAKIAYWLQKKDISVMMAACDTFRSGAVEQLQTHARSLQIPIFEKGYEKDPAIVAKQAIQEARLNGSDVVLVDTAGRMQDNEPLMRALSKLISLNSPDLVLFVGEALVGNDAVDQLPKFNQKLADLSNSPSSTVIDGILLTKFDSALSMVYVSGAPVMFVGCGQSYKDLTPLKVKTIVKNLLK
ncbi:hypothetical protein MKX03_019598 [Papaver bracteatum]|nr:hypothetical protein MKX03_019598 [Papaver bracteatum]